MQKGEEAKLKLTADALKKLGTISDFKFHSMTGDEVVKHFSSNSKNGLSDS